MDIDNGGPAFPSANEVRVGPYGTTGHAGISMRDYFAAKAMFIMWDAYDKGYCGLNNQDEPNTKIIADGAYQMADAMLKARSM